MAQTIPTLPAALRDRIGTRYAARLRKQGRLPAVIYGHKQEPVHVSVETEAMLDILQQHAHMVSVELDGQPHSCLIKEVQYNHLGNQVIHLDLTRVDLSEEVEVELEIVFKGRPKALDQTGVVLNHPMTTVTVACRADQIPENIAVDINGLTLDHPLTVADLTLPEGIKAVNDPEQLIAQLLEVEEQEVETPTETDAAAEPERIGEKKDEDDEDDDK